MECRRRFSSAAAASHLPRSCPSGANIALRLALERHAAVLSEAQAESETLNQAVSAAQSESFEMRAACTRLPRRLKQLNFEKAY